MTIKDVPDGWWQTACEEINLPLACVSITNEFIWVNDAWCAMLGYSPAEMKELTWQDITKPEDIGGDYLAVQEVLEGKRDDYTLEKTYLRKDRSEKYVRLYVHRYPRSGEVVMFIAVANETKNTQEIKEQFQEIERQMNDLLKRGEEQELRQDQFEEKLSKVEFVKDAPKIWKAFVTYVLPVVVSIGGLIGWLLLFFR